MGKIRKKELIKEEYGNGLTAKEFARKKPVIVKISKLLPTAELSLDLIIFA